MEDKQLTIVLQEYKEHYLHDLVNQFVSSLESQGFPLNEIIDGLTNYVWTNTDSIKAVCSLVEASLALATDINHGTACSQVLIHQPEKAQATAPDR